MTDYTIEAKKYLIPFYSRSPISIIKGRKHWVWDSNNNKYLDFTTGIGVVDFGHANPAINRAIGRQLKKISHISNLFIIPQQIELAKMISGKAFEGKVFFCNSGAEANESALKIARIIGNKKDKSKNKILALNESFHGRTVAAITITGQEKYRKGFEPLLQNVDFVDSGDITNLRKKFDESVCAVFLEAIQGEGGIRKLSPEFVEEIKILAGKNEAMVIFDEIQAGMGRTGKYFAYQHFSIQPDAISLAKGLGNGFPIGAVLVRNEIADAMPAGIHASTFGGNYAACAAGIASMKLLNEKILGHIQRISGYLASKLEDLKAIFPSVISENRVYGLMAGIEINEKYPVKEILDKLSERKILALRAGTNVLRLLPPYTINESAVDIFCNALYEIFGSLK